MEWILIFTIISLIIASIYTSDDIRNATSACAAAVILLLLLLGITIGCIFIFKDEIKRQAIIDYESGKYELVTKIQSDTTYTIKPIK